MSEPLEQVEFQFSEPSVCGHADMVRLGKQRAAVWAAMLSGSWWTLAELAEATGSPEASVSARLRDFRREKYGGHTVDRRRRHGPESGLHEYRLTVAGS